MNDGFARGAERDPGSRPDRLSVADAAEGASAAQHGLRLFPALLA